ncbi:hypothetical protein C0T31_09825 [Dysgonamonadaceae bacterium]|nr:hypothetical protein C0T31_09825 [Dysgonamonadaceae bacterium]
MGAEKEICVDLREKNSEKIVHADICRWKNAEERRELALLAEKISVNLREKKIRKIVHADVRKLKTQMGAEKEICVDLREKNSEKIVHAAYSKYQRKDVKKNIA